MSYRNNTLKEFDNGKYIKTRSSLAKKKIDQKPPTNTSSNRINNNINNLIKPPTVSQPIDIIQPEPIAPNVPSSYPISIPKSGNTRKNMNSPRKIEKAKTIKKNTTTTESPNLPIFHTKSQTHAEKVTVNDQYNDLKDEIKIINNKIDNTHYTDLKNDITLINNKIDAIEQHILSMGKNIESLLNTKVIIEDAQSI